MNTKGVISLFGNTLLKESVIGIKLYQGKISLINEYHVSNISKQSLSQIIESSRYKFNYGSISVIGEKNAK